MKTIVKTTLSAIGLMLALPACAQGSTPTPQAQDADPALWVVKDADTTVYLFGTVHLLKPGLSWFDEAVKTAFDKSGEVVLELTDGADPANQQLAIAKGMNPTGPALTDKVPADKRAAVKAMLDGSGVPAQAYERMDPWLANLVVANTAIGKLGYQVDSGAEKTLEAAARQSGKTLTGLETTAQQIGYFDQISDAAQIRMLVSAAEDMPKLQPMLESMIGSWAKGDPEGVAKAVNDNLRDTPEVAKTLLTDRNQRWAEWIRQRMARPGTVFVAVGAGHLAGPDSVQAQLAKLKLKPARIAY